MPLQTPFRSRTLLSTSGYGTSHTPLGTTMCICRTFRQYAYLHHPFCIQFVFKVIFVVIADLSLAAPFVVSATPGYSLLMMLCMFPPLSVCPLIGMLALYCAQSASAASRTTVCLSVIRCFVSHTQNNVGDVCGCSLPNIKSQMKFRA